MSPSNANSHDCRNEVAKRVDTEAEKQQCQAAAADEIQLALADLAAYREEKSNPGE
ncbi:hypothetical protein [Nocardia suismassiliense]|uniref:hypothetical protein n=1 Tax=Nocardia suismassiliense TaxID=2077092 RepID=UPI00131F3051|nr:hypothetical protein [Nocardia suismassiliense]